MSTDAKDQAKAAAVFRETVELLEETFDYAVGGGLSTRYWVGDDRPIADVDVLVRDDDSKAILEELERHGFTTTEMEDSWLHKGFKDGVTVDLMVELKNGTRFDDLLKDHRKRGDMFGTTCYVVPPEDQIPSLSASIDNDTIGQHWYDIVKLMANVDLDWDYVLARSERIPRRMLSVVHFAMGEQVPVPRGVIDRLTELATADRREPTT
jgi:hypothetical protein